MPSKLTRRDALRVGGTCCTTGLVAVAGCLGGGDDDGETTSFTLATPGSAWVGVAPDSIAEEKNPTLHLTAGTEYELRWENRDGAPHNIVVLDGDGNQLERTELFASEGEEQTLTFTATEEMATYACQLHEYTSEGEIVVEA
ncbi:cupredoxin domain-containing protein [Haloarchaeobius sp. DFWS5]|uniref:cupredoxin domain-containing protein n=1 Tax=Haloarchaeobius sp. DFWS5 TaxID=3446114 RepID=UPI003EBB3FEF